MGRPKKKTDHKQLKQKTNSRSMLYQKKEEVITIPTKNICLKAMIKICFKLRKE
jgi:hypothetical protein